MKKIHKISIATLATLMCVGGGVALASGSFKAPQKVEASTSITPPTIHNTYSTASCQRWEASKEPTAGAASDYATYSTAINSSTSGYYTTGTSFAVTAGQDTSTMRTYIQATQSSFSNFRAQYVPFRVDFTLQPYMKYTWTLTFKVFAARQATGGGADYSTEFFHYGETNAVPNTWFYHQGDFTESTGRGYSKIRAAGDDPTNGIGVEKTVSVTFTMENHTSGNVTKSQYFGMFCYIESSGTTTTHFTSKVTIYSGILDTYGAVVQVNNTNYYDTTAAISAYNGTSSSTMVLLKDVTFSGNNYSLGSADGTINLSGYKIDLGTTFLYITANTTITGNSNSKITSSCAYATIAILSDSILTLTGSATIDNTHTDTPTARAVLLDNQDAKFICEPGTFITTKYYGVQIDNGYLYLGGRIQSQNNAYAINIGTSPTYLKYVFLYGTYVQAQKINIGNLGRSRINASFNSQPYASSYSVQISITSGTSISLGNIVVRNVDDSNKSKFSLVHDEYGLTLSGSNLVVAYKSYSVTYSLVNLTRTGGESFVSKSADLSFTLSPSTEGNFLLPTYIGVTVAGDPLTEGTHFTYNSTTGAVVVYKENFTGNVVISATARQVLTMNFYDPEGNMIHDPMEVIKGNQFQLPFPTIIAPYYSSVYWFTNPELTGSGLYYGTNLYAGESTNYYAKISKVTKDYVDEFVGVQLHFDVDIIPVSDTSDTGACRGENGYYAIAKAVYVTFTSTQKSLFRTDATYADARARFSAWATANGETYNPSTGNITTSIHNNNGDNLNSNNGNNNMIIIICAIAAIFATSLLVLTILKKKNRK